MQNLAVELEDFLDPAPGAALAVPSKMSLGEKTFLYWLARKAYTGQGVIIDAGTLLGSSAVAFGEGLRANPVCEAARARFGKPIRSFELGITHKNMISFFRKNGVLLDAVPGSSFESAIRQFVAPVDDLVDLKVGDIQQTGGGIEERMEILFLDVLKTAPINNFALVEYFPKLIPHVSYVIQQDYFFEELWFIKVAQEFFGKKFKYLGEIGSSAVFKCIRPITRAEIRSFISNPPDDEEQIRLVEASKLRTADPERQFFVALCKAVLVATLRGSEAGLGELDKVLVEYPEQAQSGKSRLKRALVYAQNAIAKVRPRVHQETTVTP